MINDRIALLIKEMDMSVNRFSERIDVNPTVIHNIIKGRRSKPSYEVLEKIIQTFIELNSEWLMRGEGKVWKKRTSILKENTPDSKSIEIRVIYLLEVLKEKNADMHEAYELQELVETLINENDKKTKDLLKAKERQDKIIDTLAKLKRRF